MAYKRELIINNGSLTSYKKLLKVSDVCQLLDKSKYPATQTIIGVTFTNNGDGTITANGTATKRATFDLGNTPVVEGHTYLLTGVAGSTSAYFLNSYFVSSTEWLKDNICYGTMPGVIYSYVPGARYAKNYIAIEPNAPANNLVFKPQLFDLTEMYGAGNEPKTVAEFKAKFPNDLYDYSPRCWVTSYKTGLIAKTKNLFDIPLVQGYPSNTDSYDTTTLRTFTFGTYLIGMSRNNYYVPSYLTNVNISKNSISFKTSASGFGISVPFLLTVGNTYTVSCKSDNNFYSGIGITYYKEDGTLISFTDSEIVTNNPVKSFTVPENTYYTLILFYGRAGNEYTFSNIQLEEGSTATNYVPYGYL